MSEKAGFSELYPTTQMNAPPPPYTPADPNQPSAPKIGFDPVQGGAPVVNQPPATVVVQQPVLVTAPPKLSALGPESVRITCPHCQADQSTTVIKSPSIAAYVSSVLCFIFGCVCGCCLIPFCMDSCKTSEHQCANCKKFIGRYSKY